MMQAPPGPSQRMQRRSPGAEPGPPPNVPVRSISPGNSVQSRSSNASNRSAPPNGMRRSNNSTSSQMPLSQIEKSVTHLLVATKQLLETLTQWSRGQATDGQVSDVYVRLGYEFNMACRAFTAINVDTSDLGNVPELLRSILEATLSQEASTESLEKYLPRIRDIIINLLHGLKRKQQKLRQKGPRDRESGGSGGAPERTTSTSTIGSTNTGLTNLLEEGIQNGYRPDAQRESSQSAGAPATSPNRRYMPPRDQSRGSVNSEQSSMSSGTMQNIPVMPPYPGDETSMPSQPSNEINVDSFPPPPPPPKQQSSAFAALQKGGDLERRASRRYSQYQISKHLGGAVNGMPMLPSQNSPIPNRGRGEVRESLRAVQTRETLRQNRASKQPPADSSPAPSRGAEESAETSTARPESPTIQTPEDKYPKPSATINGPLSDDLPIMSPDDDEPAQKPLPPVKDEPRSPQVRTPEKKRDATFLSEQSPPLTKDLTLFLQYKSKVKKFVLPEGYSELSLGRLQLAFIEKFSWNTQANGADLPEIYIQDPVSGVRHELEDLSDIKDRTVLVLNVEALDEVKRHIDDGIGQLKKIVQDVKQNVDDQGLAIQRVSDRQQETATEMARLAAMPPVVAAPADGAGAVAVGGGRKLAGTHLTEIQSLRRDLAVMRQAYSKFQSEIQGSMSLIRNKASNVKSAVVKASVPTIEGETGHAYVTKGREQLNADSDRLVARVDDLQDLVEDLRKDVVLRGVRPLPRQLEGVAKDITKLSKELKKVEDYMKEEKPIWTKIWEKELEEVCKGRDELRLMEDLMVDLQDDLEKASETFALVEQATKEQMKDNGSSASAGTARNFSKGLNNLGNSLDQNAAKDGVLGEVRALQPNHENRLEAIERAEKLRQKELAGRKGNELQRELANFVEEGKLKKSGGFEEVERARLAKDERIRKEVWERQNGIIAEGEEEEEGVEYEYEEVEEEEEEEAGAAADAAAPDGEKSPPPPPAA
ncbi:Bud site selection protein 6 [Colletotrichum fructicola Nara gc5]|uniref:Bud site selection protein 6 n=1 Tax=Colletotrichum fructicola (strain Nara gc5) TaxID=1213859 RepID=A0A7J6J149_COLFN|nr:Bud site selection protein 6 [Colletotrichum fructicola Nara gc5]KAF5508041.1 Bud site selection protein 6 [Colletotrichum fructicola]